LSPSPTGATRRRRVCVVVRLRLDARLFDPLRRPRAAAHHRSPAHRWCQADRPRAAPPPRRYALAPPGSRRPARGGGRFRHCRGRAAHEVGAGRSTARCALKPKKPFCPRRVTPASRSSVETSSSLRGGRATAASTSVAPMSAPAFSTGLRASRWRFSSPGSASTSPRSASTARKRRNDSPSASANGALRSVTSSRTRSANAPYARVSDAQTEGPEPTAELLQQ